MKTDLYQCLGCGAGLSKAQLKKGCCPHCESDVIPLFLENEGKTDLSPRVGQTDVRVPDLC